jgi:hypothetical protein
MGLVRTRLWRHGRQAPFLQPHLGFWQLALLICGNYYEGGEGEICLMLAEPGEDAEAA